MDIDNDLSENRENDVELEQSLLQQFSCLGTTDKEELVKQLQRFLGSQLNETAASFFLDMNNWNLQAAICSYFDIDAPNKLPSMALIPDPLANETESVEPNTSPEDGNAAVETRRFKKSWVMCNNGGESWPIGCHFQFSSGDNLSDHFRIPVSSLAPGQTTNITLEFISPSKPGVYQTKYRMCTPGGSYFGDPIWAIVSVVEEGTMALTQQLSHFSELGSSPNQASPSNPFGQSRQHNSEKDTDSGLDQDSQMC